MREIVERYRKFKDGKDEDWIYDETYEFFNDLTRSELCEIMNFLEKQFPINPKE